MKFAASVSAALLASTLALSGQQPRFSSSTEMVRLVVSATDADGTVRGLKSSDFVVTDNGQKQTVQADEGQDAPLDLVILAQPVQSIASTSKEQSIRMFAGLSAVFPQLRDSDRVAAVLAGAPPVRLRALEPGRPAFDQSAFLTGEYAAPVDAIASALREIPASDRRQALIAFTAGVDFRSTLTPAVVAKAARQHGPALVFVASPVKVDVTVGPLAGPARALISGWSFPAVIRDMASSTGGFTLDLGRGDPSKLIDGLFGRLRTQYVLTYAAPKGQGWHAVSVKVNRRGVIASTRDGYWVD
jgi:hypothetical protein